MVDSWPIIWPEGAGNDTADAEKVLAAETATSATLRMLTLYRVGGSPITVMPCARSCRKPRMRVGMFHPVLLDSGNYANCWCSAGCSCASNPTVTLEAPVGRIDEVRVNGEVVPASAYQVEDGNKLVRVDGKGWPACAGKDFTVTYLNAYPVDEYGQYVGGFLAAEYLKAFTNDKKCKLPGAVRSLTRQGISYEITPGLFPNGLTNIAEVDSFLLQWNPNGLRVKPQVYSPDMPKQRVVTIPRGL
jgi:hypothetical protein